MADEAKTYTQAEVEAMVQEKLAEAKASQDKAFSELWKEAKQAKEKAREYEGVNLEEWKTLKAKEQELKAAKVGITAADLDKLRGEIRADLDKEYAPRLTAAEQALLENRSLKLDNVVKTHMAKGGARADRIDALFKLTQDRYDLTSDGQPVLKNAMGTPIPKYISEELMKEYPEFFNGTGSSGGGASKSSAGGGGSVTRIAAPQGGVFGKDFLSETTLKGLANGTVVVDQ